MLPLSIPMNVHKTPSFLQHVVLDQYYKLGIALFCLLGLQRSVGYFSYPQDSLYRREGKNISKKLLHNNAVTKICARCRDGREEETGKKGETKDEMNEGRKEERKNRKTDTKEGKEKYALSTQR